MDSTSWEWAPDPRNELQVQRTGSRPQGWTPDPWNGSYFPGMNSRPWERTPDLGNGHFQGWGSHRFSGILIGMGHRERLGWRRTGKGGWERLPTIPSYSHPAAPEVRTREIPFLLHPGLPPSNPRISRWMGPSCHPQDLPGSSTSHPGIAPADPGGRWIPGILPPGDSQNSSVLSFPSHGRCLEQSLDAGEEPGDLPKVPPPPKSRIQDPEAGTAEDLGRRKTAPEAGRERLSQIHPRTRRADSPKDIWSWDEASWAQGPKNYPRDGNRGKPGTPGMCQG